MIERSWQNGSDRQEDTKRKLMVAETRTPFLQLTSSSVFLVRHIDIWRHKCRIGYSATYRRTATSNYLAKNDSNW